jgi:predicted  nucleic acid-binding Zn-ribbon protein
MIGRQRPDPDDNIIGFSATAGSVPAVDTSVSLVDVERAIEQASTRYIADLRALSETFRQYYAAQLTIQLAAKEEQLAGLEERAAVVEQERNALAARVDELQRTEGQRVAELQALHEALNRVMSNLSARLGEHPDPAPQAPDPGDATTVR